MGDLDVGQERTSRAERPRYDARVLHVSTIGSIGPGVAFLRVRKTTQLYRGMKADYGVSLTCGGRSISRVDGRERLQTQRRAAAVARGLVSPSNHLTRVPA